LRSIEEEDLSLDLVDWPASMPANAHDAAMALNAWCEDLERACACATRNLGAIKRHIKDLRATIFACAPGDPRAHELRDERVALVGMESDIRFGVGNENFRQYRNARTAEHAEKVRAMTDLDHELRRVVHGQSADSGEQLHLAL
jgi:hypothetical protein